jgi:hypothetical protein
VLLHDPGFMADFAKAKAEVRRAIELAENGSIFGNCPGWIDILRKA